MQGSEPNSNLKKYQEEFWDFFFQDKFKQAIDQAKLIKGFAPDPNSQYLAEELEAKVYLRQGKFRIAKNILDSLPNYNSGFKLFLDFLNDANPEPLLRCEFNDCDSLIYKSQAFLISYIYWGKEHLKAMSLDHLDPNQILEEAVEKFLIQKEYDRAILAAIQTLELTLEDQAMSHDLHLPLMKTHLDNLLKLSTKAKFNSVKAKVFLVKARILKDREAAEDAEILFGKEGNTSGLGEVYLTYAKDFDEEAYYAKALKAFEDNDNVASLGFLYVTLASQALIRGEINKAIEFFDKSKIYLEDCGVFEQCGLEIQRISLLAITGKYQKVKEAIHEMIKPTIPAFFMAQAYQILSNTMIQLGEDLNLAKGYIETSCDIFKQLKRYNQLLYTQNVLFQILLLENNLDAIDKLGQEIIRLATRLGNEEIKASKYLDLAFVTIRLSLEKGELDEEKVASVIEYFKKAIKLYQDQDNLIGEADIYQAMGNMYTGIGKLEEALNAFLTAKKMYRSESAFLQAAITDTLIGILMLNYVVLNEQSYMIAHRHFEQALVYFTKENLLDLTWKVTFYLADLNHRLFIINKDHPEAELYENKAKTQYLEMLCAIQEFEQESNSLSFDKESGFAGITMEDAFNKAHQFFLTIGEHENAQKFRKHLN